MNYGKADLARQYRDEYDKKLKKIFPDGVPTLKLARILHGDHKLKFRDVEDARGVLRDIEGKNRKPGKSVTITHPHGKRPYNPYALPESDEEEYLPYFIKGHKRVLTINDLHFPYHNQQAITSCFDFSKKENPDAIFVNGDLIDCHLLSPFLRDPRKKNFAEELGMLKTFFQILSKTFKCKIYYKLGNHEERYEKFLFQKAHELVGVEEFEIENIIKARAEGIEVIKDKRLVVMNGLPFVHGHEFGRGLFSPVNAARGLFLQAKHSAVKGDCHNTSEHPEPNIFGKLMTTWSIGCLCGLHPHFLPINKWNHGFAMIDLDKNGREYQFRNFRMENGKIL